MNMPTLIRDWKDAGYRPRLTAEEPMRSPQYPIAQVVLPQESLAGSPVGSLVGSPAVVASKTTYMATCNRFCRVLTWDYTCTMQC